MIEDLGRDMVSLPSRIANQIKPWQRIIPNERLHYPCADPNASADVLSYTEASEFYKLNKRNCSIPIGEIIQEATAYVIHPIVYVSATATTLPDWDAVAWTPPDEYLKPVANIKYDDGATGFSKDI